MLHGSRCLLLMCADRRKEVNCLRKSSLQDDLFSRQFLIHVIDSIN